MPIVTRSGSALRSNFPERVILLERPSGEILQQWPRGEVLLYYWELLFHARVHEAFECLAEQHGARSTSG